MLRSTNAASFIAGAVVATSLGAWAVPHDADPEAERYASLDSFAQVLHYVSTDYVDPVDEQKLLWDASKGIMSGLDVHSTFLPPRRYTRLREDTEGAFGGVGLTLGPGDADGIMPDALRWPIVDEVVPGSPADKAGVQVDDRIVAIDGTATVDAKGGELHEAGYWEQKTRGASGTRVELSIVRVGAETPAPVSLVRELVKMPSVQALAYAKRIGYLSIGRFQEATSDDTLAALKELKDQGALDVLILDLRGDPGGLLDQSIRVADLFLDDGVIVTIRGRQGAIETHSAHAAGTWSDVKLLVMVDAGTASAAEILAGALQDHQRATIQGMPTYGKGSVQTFFDLDDGSGLKLTTARYYTPSGRSVEGTGITPDLEVDEYASEVIVAGGEIETGEDVAGESLAGAGAETGNDARIREELAEDFQFQAAYQTAVSWLGSK